MVPDARAAAESPLLLIPGPTPVPRRVLEALARPTLAHNSPASGFQLKRLQTGLLRSLGFSGESEPELPAVLVTAGSGTSAMESALVNTVAPGEAVVVVSHGFFGDRFADLARGHGARVEQVSCEWGEQVAVELVDRALTESGAAVLTVTHVDTANGVVSPLSAYAQVARAHGALLVLDAVASQGGMPIEMAQEGIDVVVAASQKALAMPPGLAIVVASQRALEHRRRLKAQAGYFLDWLNWLAPMADPTRDYFATLPTNLIAAGAVAIEVAETEGWPARFARHRQMASAARRGLRAMGLYTVSGDELLGATVSALAVPPGIPPAALQLEVAKEGVAVAGGLARWRPGSIRIGHMGATSLPELLRGVAALEQALVRLGVPVERGAGVAELLSGWEAGAG
ncbi:MAG TPA: alanine--glyoxylate aminotransferase family protein [Candidatus Dormibacteraeota bacterium]|nr:alanine--glyoxylate aminotransferase family protein [Candidatus Dormibacteraeota bacterium]